MKYHKQYRKAFGLNENGAIDFPKKMSNVRISRIRNYRIMGGCNFCFPHGFESINARHYKLQRSWKKHRKTQWK